MARRKTSTPTLNFQSGNDKARGVVEIEDFHGNVRTFSQCEVNVSGSSAALYSWDDADERFIRIDGMKRVAIEQHATFLEFRGTSDKLSSDRRTPSDQCLQTWRLYPQGCQDCD